MESESTQKLNLLHEITHLKNSIEQRKLRTKQVREVTHKLSLFNQENEKLQLEV